MDFPSVSGPPAADPVERTTATLPRTGLNVLLELALGADLLGIGMTLRVRRAGNRA